MKKAIELAYNLGIKEAITYTQALQNLAMAIERVNNDHIPIIITSENHKPVVMISLEEFNAW